MGLGTLLGPEGPNVLLLREWGRGFFRTATCWLGVSGWWCRPYVENYTVDASIFDRVMVLLSGGGVAWS